MIPCTEKPRGAGELLWLRLPGHTSHWHRVLPCMATPSTGTSSTHGQSPTLFLQVTVYPHLFCWVIPAEGPDSPQTRKNQIPRESGIKINIAECQIEGSLNKVPRVQSVKHQKSNWECNLYNLPMDSMYSFNFLKML